MNCKTCKDHLGNEYRSKYAMCKHYGVKQTTFNERIKAGLSVKDALTSPLSKRAQRPCKDHLGNEYESKEAMAKAYGFKDYRQIKDRLYRGWTLEQALTIPMGGKNDQWVECADHLGNVYPNKAVLCEAYGITLSAYSTRTKAGWDLERVLTTPLKDISPKVNRVGERSVCRGNGMGMEIIAYRNAYDIDIRFDDGIEVYNKEYNNFKKGGIARPKGVDKWEYKGSLIGRRGIAKCGMGMEIINVHKNGHIDVRFDDGEEVYDKVQENFKSGYIKHPKISYIDTNLAQKVKSLVGQKKKNTNGYEMELIEYRGSGDITVRFSNGETVKSRMNQWRKGGIKEPYTIHIGETYMATNGQKMTITAYHSNTNVDVVFEDGTEIKHKTYINVKTGQIKNPNKLPSTVRTKHRLGEIHKANSGEMVQIIEYNNANDMTVKVLETGYIIHGVTYSRLVKGEIDATDYSSRTGTVVLANCGLYMTCIDYKNSSKTGTVVRFEDGTERVCNWGRFLLGEVGHPCLTTNGVKKPFVLYGVLVKKLAYRYNSVPNYYCILPDGTKDVLCISEIKERFGGDNALEEKGK